MLIAIIVSVFVAIQDPIIQKFAVRFAGGFLSEKTGADIKVGRLAVTPDLRIFIDDVTVKDLKNNNLAVIGALRTKIDIGDLLEGKIHLGSVELRNTEANLIQYEGENQLNFAFLVDAFASDTVKEKESKPMAIVIDRISLKNIDFVFWNQNKDRPDKTERNLMDYAHLDLDDINLEVRDFSMFGDSINANIGLLSAKELSGLELKHLKADAVICQKGIFLNGLQMETNNSLFDLDLSMLFNGFDDFDSFVDSVVFDATIHPTDVLLSDIGVFTEVMYKMPDRLQFEGRFTGPIEHFRVDNFQVRFGRSTMIQGNISMHPLDFENGYHTLNIRNMQFSYDDLANFYIPSSTKTIPMPESLRPMDKGRISLNFKGSYSNFVSDITLTSGIGDIDASIARANSAKGDNVFSGFINAERVKAGMVANASKFVGDLDLNANFMAKFPKNGKPEFRVDGNAYHAELLGNRIDIIKMDGAMQENRFNGNLTVNDNSLYLDFNGMIDFVDPKHPKSDFEAIIRNADLHALKILNEDSISQFSTKIYVNMTGFDIDNLEGVLHLDSTLYTDSRGQYFMKDFNASIIDDNLMQRRIKVNCDFLDFEMAGKVNFAHLMPALNEFGNSFVNFPIWKGDMEKFQKIREKNDVEQDFIVQLNLKDTKTISRLMMPSLKVAKNTSVNATFTSQSRMLNLTARSKSIMFGDLTINDFELKNFNTRKTLFGSLSVGEIAWSNISEKDTIVLGIENLSIRSRMTNDTIATSISWDDQDEEDHNKSQIDTYFHPHEHGGIFSITSAEMLINDSLWKVSSNNFVDITNGRVAISNLMFAHHSQSIRVDGYVPMNESDTISLQLQKFDISNLDFLFKGFNIDGFISGDALVSSLKADPMVLADLDIQRIAVNGDMVGNALVSSLWNNDNKSIDLKANIYDQRKKTLNVYGSYYTARKTDNLDFTVELDSLQLNILSPLLTGVVTRMQGYGNGQIDITGSIKQPDIQGYISMKDGGCKIGYLNTFYTFSPTIKVDNKTIAFENMVLTDTLGNTAIVEGKINHNNLKDFNLDLKLHPRDFLALATSSKDNNTFYGTAVADGLISVTGPFNNIKLSIDALTRRGTHVTIPLNRSSTVKDNDFIVFVNNAAVDEDEEEMLKKEEKPKSNFSMKLNVKATDDANLKIILPGKLGTIEASGNGNVKMNTATSEDFTMFGGYTIKSGRFQLTLMDVVTRMFNLKSGGTLSWSGDPTKGIIDATGAYSVKAPLSGLGVPIDSTANSNVNVECLIHLKGALLNPTITFGMNLPNTSEDITQTVFSVVDTTNQAVLTSQALSLLVLGSFANVAGGAADSWSLSNMIGASTRFDITNNLNLGLRYQSGNYNTYDEYQLALHTELFENRLTIETNLGMMTANNPNASNASSIVGEFDLYYKLTRDGRLQAHFYNHSNYNSNFNSIAFDKRAPYTQGLGLSYSRSFNTLRDLFKRRKPVAPNQPLINPRRKGNN